MRTYSIQLISLKRSSLIGTLLRALRSSYSFSFEFRGSYLISSWSLATAKLVSGSTLDNAMTWFRWFFGLCGHLSWYRVVGGELNFNSSMVNFSCVKIPGLMHHWSCSKGAWFDFTCFPDCMLFWIKWKLNATEHEVPVVSFVLLL